MSKKDNQAHSSEKTNMRNQFVSPIKRTNDTSSETCNQSTAWFSTGTKDYLKDSSTLSSPEKEVQKLEREIETLDKQLRMHLQIKLATHSSSNSDCCEKEMQNLLAQSTILPEFFQEEKMGAKKHPDLTQVIAKYVQKEQIIEETNSELGYEYFETQLSKLEEQALILSQENERLEEKNKRLERLLRKSQLDRQLEQKESKEKIKQLENQVGKLKKQISTQVINNNNNQYMSVPNQTTSNESHQILINLSPEKNGHKSNTVRIIHDGQLDFKIEGEPLLQGITSFQIVQPQKQS